MPEVAPPEFCEWLYKALEDTASLKDKLMMVRHNATYLRDVDDRLRLKAVTESKWAFELVDLIHEILSDIKKDICGI